jgi:tyrosine-specific transport protein
MVRFRASRGSKSSSWKIPALIVAATVGDGIFALPYIFSQAGWLLGVAYLAVLGAIIIATHAIYLKTLEHVGEKQRLLGLARKYFGEGGFWLGFVAIVAGLLMGFIIFLILGTQFLLLLIPALPYLSALAIVWVVIALPALLSNRRVVPLEIGSAIFVACLIIFVFLSSNAPAAVASIPAVSWPNFFLPFGVILFSLAGWTSIEPVYESMRIAEKKKIPWGLIIAGTAVAALLYLMFALGILGSAPRITADTVSGLAAWPTWKKDLIALLGLSAIIACSMPISHEIRNALEKDLHWDSIASGLIVVSVPLVAVLLGFTNFLVIVSVAGAVFVGMQYFLMIAVGRRALSLSLTQKILLDIMAGIFVVAAVYQIASFVVR